MSATPLQATINKWVNYEAIMEYAAMLHRWAKEERWADRIDIANGLSAAGFEIEAAAGVALQATRTATDAAYARIYGDRSTA